MLVLPPDMIAEMIAHARDEFPLECCGLLAGNDGVAVKLMRATNIEASEFRYQVDPRELMRFDSECDANGWEFSGVYHSHTRSEAYPSPTDVKLAKGWPQLHYILVSLENPDSPVVRAFRITDGAITEEETG